jgi:beta-glucanase (GH16 family)
MRRQMWRVVLLWAVGCSDGPVERSDVGALDVDDASVGEHERDASAAARDGAVSEPSASEPPQQGARDATTQPSASERDGGRRSDAAMQPRGPERDATAAVDAAASARDASASSLDGALPGWKLAWSDEFDGPANALPNAQYWQFETGGHGFGNNQLEFNTARPENASLDGQGALVLTARKESYMGSSYTSARLKTQGKLERTHGRFEARMRLPQGQGIWPAFWMLGSDIGGVSWPACGEIDIMENIGKEPTIVHGTLHGPGYSGASGIGAPYSLPNGGRYADDYHVFAIEWEEQVVRWYVDGKLYQTRTPRDLPSGAKWVYEHPFFLLLNLAVGGQWPGNPDAATVFPQRLTVDYVRVYERAR